MSAPGAPSGESDSAATEVNAADVGPGPGTGTGTGTGSGAEGASDASSSSSSDEVRTVLGQKLAAALSDEPTSSSAGEADAADGEHDPSHEAARPDRPDRPDHGAAPDAQELAAELDRCRAERDDFKDRWQRAAAEFQNFRRRANAERQQEISAGVARLVSSLLPVLDGCDAAQAAGMQDVAPVAQSLMLALSNAGLERMHAVGAPFDPTEHDAVRQEPPASASAAATAAATVSEPVLGASGDADCRHADFASGDASEHPEASAAAGTAAADGSAVVSTDGPDEATPCDDDAVPVQMVTAELRAGYRFGGRVLRAAMVAVTTTGS